MSLDAAVAAAPGRVIQRTAEQEAVWVIYLGLDGLASRLVVREMFMLGALEGGLSKRLQSAKQRFALD